MPPIPPPHPHRSSPLPIGVIVVAWGLLAGIPAFIGAVVLIIAAAGYGSELLIPMALAVLMLVVACLWIVRTRINASLRDARRHEGACVRCGYDMRSIPLPICPECGLPDARTADPAIWARWPWELWALHLASIAIGAAALWLAIRLSR
ncbi:MAG: hypothetical protein KIT68_02440 [Phycisphaeraceae bacterium]|nr:hypothetical protein [Phycisphaeraceae bacterium]